MKINKYWFWENPQNIVSPVAVIDTWTATTNLVILLHNNPEHLIIVNETNLDRAKSIYPESIIIGESLDLPNETFNYPNLPSVLIDLNLSGKTILFMTVNGTRAFEKYSQNFQAVAASFINLKIIVNFIKKYNQATIIMAGDRTDHVLEDEICGEVIINEIEKKTYQWEDIKSIGFEAIINHYRIPVEERARDLDLVFSVSKYDIIPVGMINSEGFVEIKNLTLK